MFNLFFFLLFSDPDQRAYSIWVSEVMLQQTQVATVIEYYNKWIKRWPTVLDLAKATLEEVNEMWAGLGYYSRGRRLHEGAQKLAKQRGKKSGQMPANAKDLMKELPGVGRYTAGAVASISYNEVTGIVDGNVIRVMSRLRMIGGDISTQPVSELIWELANKVVDEELPGDFNQSLMELGATVCTPQNPKCTECPVSKICKAYKRLSMSRSGKKDFFNKNVVESDEKPAQKELPVKNEADVFDALGDVELESNDEEFKDEKTVIDLTSNEFVLADIEDFPDCKFCISSDEPWNPEHGVGNYPRKPKRKPPKAENYLSIMIESNSKYLFVQRPESGLLANMWEFPLTQIEKENKEAIELNVVKKELKRRFGIEDFDYVRFCGEASHVFSHRCHLYRIYHAMVSSIPESVVDAEGRPLRWMNRTEINIAAITSAIKKIMTVKEKCRKGIKRKSGEKLMSQQTLDKMFKKN